MCNSCIYIVYCKIQGFFSIYMYSMCVHVPKVPRDSAQSLLDGFKVIGGNVEKLRNRQARFETVWPTSKPSIQLQSRRTALSSSWFHFGPNIHNVYRSVVKQGRQRALRNI